MVFKVSVIRCFNKKIKNFSQVICKGAEDDGKIGIAIESSVRNSLEEELTTIVCVHYERRKC